MIMIEQETERAKLLTARKGLYQLLHVLLSQPINEKIYRQIKNEGYIEGLADLGEGGVALVDFFEDDDIEGSLKLAQEDYYQLFIGPYALPTPPWESVYRGKEHSLFDFPTFEVRRLYSEFGLELTSMPNQHVEAEDHIAFELEFMMLLSDRIRQEKNKEKLIEMITGQKVMIHQHLKNWVPQFTRDIQKYAKSKLFLGVAILLNEFINFDSIVIDELLNEM